MAPAPAAPAAPPAPPDDRGAAPSEHAEHRLGLALAAGAAVLFGSSYLATAFALRSFSPLGVGAWRGIGAALVLLVVVETRGGRLLARVRSLAPGDLGRLALVGTLGGPGLVLGMNVAVALAGATIASFVAGLYAVLAAVFAPFLLRERLGPTALAGFFLALGGTALLAELDPARSDLLGFGAGLGAAVSYALYLVLSRRWAGRSGALTAQTVTFANFAMAALVLVPLDLATEPGRLLPTAPAPEALLGLAWLVVFPSIVANLMIQGSVRRIPARRSSALLLLNPVAVTLLSPFLLGERLAGIQLAGAALVLAGMAIASGLLGPVARGVPARARR